VSKRSSLYALAALFPQRARSTTFVAFLLALLRPGMQESFRWSLFPSRNIAVAARNRLHPVGVHSPAPADEAAQAAT
jgi:hypothetical protein